MPWHYCCTSASQHAMQQIRAPCRVWNAGVVIFGVSGCQTWILGRKALGLRSRMASTAAWRTCSDSLLLQQLTQLQLSQ